MKNVMIVPVLFSFAVASCDDAKRSESESHYRIQCSPKILKVDGGLKLMPCIEWEQSSSENLTYRATTYYRRPGSSDLIRSLESYGGGIRASDTSSSTVELASIDECLVLITVLDGDKNVKGREWHTTKINN